MQSRFYDEDHEAFREVARKFVLREVAPQQEEWDRVGHIDPALWRAAGRQGLLGLAFPEEYGGGGVDDFRYRCVLMDELAKVGAAAVDSQLSLVDDLAGPYLVELGTDAQRKRWLPGLTSGETSPAIAMTEPGAGSDLRGIATSAVQDGDGWRLNGSKTFITNGGHADVIVVVARTDARGGFHGFSLLVVERAMEGFSSGSALDKIGQRAENVAELFFDDVLVPADNLLGEIGQGLPYLKQRLPKERLSIGYYGLAAAEAALHWTLAHVKERKAFGGSLAALQHVRFELAELSTAIDVTRSYLQDCVLAFNDGALSATDAAKAKWWATDLQQRVVDRCLQLHGGYGYMREYPIARAFVDARVQTIYGGANEVMKEVIARDLTR
jgi:alkylation response protein AidB-like acyl-CoA dehydrogenase